MLELFGLDAKSQARGELGALDSRRQGFETWDLGDRLRSLVTGVSREELERLSGQIADEKLEAIYGPQAAANAENLGALTAAYQGVDNKTEAEIKSQIARDNQRGRALQQTLANNPEFDLSTLSNSATTGQILQAGSKATKASNETEVRRQEGRFDDRLALQLELNRLDRKDDREARRDQTALANRRLDIQEARGMRRDRQAAIQQMMAGLAQMGASIAI